MGFVRTLMLLVACILPWQSVQADLLALKADAPATMDMAMSADMPCDQAPCDCCDKPCQQMAFCPALGALYLPAQLAVAESAMGMVHLYPSVPPTPLRVDPALPLRPPIPFPV